MPNSSIENEYKNQEVSKNSKKLRFRKTLVGWSFVIVAVVLICTFYFYPMLQSFLLSFQSGAGANLEFVGLENYKRLLTDPVFLAALKNTLTYLIIQVPIMIVIAMFLAVLLNDKTLKYRGAFRTSIFLPCITSLVAYSLIFKCLFAPDGLINQILMQLGIISDPYAWLQEPFTAKLVIIIAITWRWTGYNMIFFLSALQNVDESIYEAARIDGASARQRFTSITLPILKPVILFTAITSTIGTLQIFDEVVNITGGGPGTATISISQYIYNVSFLYAPDFGYAATVSYAIVVLVVFFAIIQFKVVGDRDE